MTAKEIKRTLQSEFVRTLRKPFVDAVKAYGLVKPSDKVAVCISGGKDSMLLALLLQDLQHIGTIIGIAGGKSKAAAILSVIRASRQDILITDEAAAHEILKMAKE